MNYLKDIAKMLAFLHLCIGATAIVFYTMLFYIMTQKATTIDFLWFTLSGFGIFLMAIAIKRYWKLFDEYIGFYSKMIEEVDKID